MSYKLLLARYFNSPMLLSENYINILNNEVFLKLLAEEPISRTESTPVREVKQKNKIAIIPVHGSLVNKNGAGASGITSYERIQRDIFDYINAGIDVAGFDISTNGGEASGNFPLADFIHSLPEKYGIRTFSFTDSEALSGGYSLFAAAQQRFAVDTSFLGSIGVISTLADLTAMDKQDGIKYEIFRTRNKKAPYNPHEGISEDARKQIQALAKVYDTKFAESITKYLGIDMKVIDELDGAVIDSKRALELGLVDEIVTSIDDVLSIIESKSFNVNKQIGVITMATQEETLQKLVEVQSELASLKASTELKIRTAVQEERDRCLHIMEAKKTFGVSEQSALNQIKKGTAIDIVTDMFEEIKATMDEKSFIDTSTASQSSANSVTIAELQEKARKQKEDTGRIFGGGLYSMDDLMQGMIAEATGGE